MTSLLAVQNLCVIYTAAAGRQASALSQVTFEVGSGETLGVLGESGSGKSTLGAALLRMLPANGSVTAGSVRFEGRELLQCPQREIETLRGQRIALIFQEPSLALHPALRVKQQVSDVLTAHQRLPRRAAQQQTQEILSAVFPTDVQRIANAYPHELSGGQRARVLIAQAISCKPSLIIADEPTASLDAETQREVVALFGRLRRQFPLALIWITHNPELLRGFADRVMVLYGGRVVEIGPSDEVLSSPQHPYSQALLACMPPPVDFERSERKALLPTIAAESHTPLRGAESCVFESRCTDRMLVCAQQAPGAVQLNDTHEVACFKHAG